MRATVHPSVVFGQAAAPASKSHAIRALLLAALARGDSAIRNPPPGQDAQAAVRAARALGALVDGSDPGCWQVRGTGGVPSFQEPCSVDAGNSGTTLYMAMTFAALAETGHLAFDGDAQLRGRPVEPLARALEGLGARVARPDSGDGWPLCVSGRLRGGAAAVDCATSQFVSALMMSCPLARGGSLLTVTNPRERPYLEMTRRWMERLGARLDCAPGWGQVRIPGGQRWDGFACGIPGDWSAAAFLLMAGALSPRPVTVAGLDLDDTQGDKAIVGMLRKMGARISASPEGSVTVQAGPGGLRGARLDLSDTPDLLPALAVAGSFAQGVTRLVNVAHARRKETDRVAVMARELSALGARVRERPDGLEIEGGRLSGGLAESHGDHRVAMALAVAGLRADGPVAVRAAEAAGVSFPGFWDTLGGLSADVCLE